MAKKVCNNKVEFIACGKDITFRLSDEELKALKYHTIVTRKNEDRRNLTCGDMYNFAAYAFFEYDATPTKYGRFAKNFPYHDFETIYWNLI